MSPTRQSWNAESYVRDAGFVAELGQTLIDLLVPQSGERVLDIGCGDGRLTQRLGEAGAVVVAIDSSPEMVDAAKQRGIDARHVDAYELEFDSEFDAVFSNAALHWMTRPDVVAEKVAQALKSGGRFVGEFGGHGNVAAIVTALLAVADAMDLPSLDHIPWYFPTATQYSTLLDNHGFRVDMMDHFARPTRLDAGMHPWLATFAGPFCHALTDSQKVAYLERVVALLRHSLCDDQGNWTADYVRLRFHATKQ